MARGGQDAATITWEHQLPQLEDCGSVSLEVLGTLFMPCVFHACNGVH